MTYHLRISEEHKETAQRVHGFHAKYCPVYRSITPCIQVTTELVFEKADTLSEDESPSPLQPC